MRRMLVLVCAAAAATVTLTGCSGVDAQRAQSLLQQAQQAQQSVTSERFVVKLSFDVDGKSAEIDMQGGGYSKGEHAGDFFLTMSGSLPTGTFPLDLLVEKRGSAVTMRANGETQTLSLPQAEQQLGAGLDDFSHLADFARYVKGVSVSDGDFMGRPADKVVGTLDTQGLVSGAGGFSSKVFGDLGVHLGDVRVVLYLPRDTHLVESMVAEMSISAQGHTAHMTMSLGVTGVNQPVDFPSV